MFLCFRSLRVGWGWRVTMLSVGVLVRSTLLRLPARGLCSAVIHKKSTASRPIWSVPESAAVCLHRSPARNLSGGPGSSLSGWYSDLADSAPVHLCEHLLVSMQQVSSLPWWLSIAVATLSVRTLITLPLAAYQLVIISKVPVLKVVFEWCVRLEKTTLVSLF